MRNLYNAVSDMMNSLNMGTAVQETITQDQENHRKWLLRLDSKPNCLSRSSVLIEIIEEEDGDASVCVLRSHNVGRRSLHRLMRKLVDVLDDSPPLQPRQLW
jgi:hypothetical protein